MTQKLSGKVAVVTGGSRGIGAIIANALAENGADVAISYAASEDKAKAVVDALWAKGVRAQAYKADQASSDEVNGLVQAVARDFGRLDILGGERRLLRHTEGAHGAWPLRQCR